MLALLGAAPALSSLSLPQAPLVTGAMLEELPTCVPQLQELHLQDCRQGRACDSISTLFTYRTVVLLP